MILHYIPLTEVARRLFSKKGFQGKLYQGFEIQYSDRKLGARAFGRSNSTLWFETAQARADYMLQACGDEGPCRVAGLQVCSDSSYACKHMGLWGVYCKPLTLCTDHVLIMYFACISCTGQYAKTRTPFKIAYNSL